MSNFIRMKDLLVNIDNVCEFAFLVREEPSEQLASAMTTAYRVLVLFMHGLSENIKCESKEEFETLKATLESLTMYSNGQLGMHRYDAEGNLMVVVKQRDEEL